MNNQDNGPTLPQALIPNYKSRPASSQDENKSEPEPAHTPPFSQTPPADTFSNPTATNANPNPQQLSTNTMGHGVHLSSPGATSTTNTDTSYDSASHSSPRSKTPITNGPEIPESSIIKDTTPEDSSRSKAPANENRPVFKASTPKGPPHPKAPVTTNHSHSGAPAIHDYPYLRGTINKGSKVTKAPAAKISTTNSKTNGLKAIEETIIEPKKVKAVKETPLKQMPKVTKKRNLAELDENDTDNEKTPVKKPKKKPAAVEKPAAAKKPRATPTPPPPSTRPTRTRKAPVRFADEQQQQKEDLKKKPSTPKATSSKVFDPEYITTNPKSRLVNTDIYVNY